MKKDSSKRTPWMVAVVILGLTAVAWPAQAQDRDETPKRDPWAKYEVILERNMFSRQRGFLRRREDEPRRGVVVPNPESYFRFNGVVQEDGTFIAFVEDTRSNSVLRLRAGNQVARGVIRALVREKSKEFTRWLREQTACYVNYMGVRNGHCVARGPLSADTGRENCCFFRKGAGNSIRSDRTLSPCGHKIRVVLEGRPGQAITSSGGR